MPTSLFPGSNTKNAIVNILSQNPPLTVKEIHHQVKKETQKDITYQAAHKAIVELAKDNLISKNLTNRYQINPDWVNKLADFKQNITKIGNPPEKAEFRTTKRRN